MSGADEACGAPVDAQTMLLTALGDFPGGAETLGIPLESGSQVSLEAFPPRTRVLEVELVGSGEGFRAVGKTVPFRVDELEDGDRLRVFMAPPGGACPTESPLVPRARPLAARAGPGALVGGGVDADGAPADGLEYYDPGTARFVEVGGERLYGDGDTGLLGATMTELPDGRVLVAGGGVPAFQLYDPDAGELDSALFLRQLRAHHATVALGDGRVLMAGGCGQLTGDGACDPASLFTSTTILDVDTGADSDGPVLQRPRVGGAAVLEPDGRVLLVGGVDAAGDPVAAIERVDLDGGSELVPGGGAAVAPLQAGGVVTGFAAAGTDASVEAAVLPPGAGQVAPVGPAPSARAGVTLTPLQDGSVLAIGDGPALSYVPQREQFVAMARAPSALSRREHAAVRLGDGTVLVIGGRREGTVAGDAWVVRPDLTGPHAAGVTINFGDPALARHAVPLDPSRARTVDDGESAVHYELESSGQAGGVPSQWAVVGGPTLTSGSVRANLRVSSSQAGAALLWAFEGPRDHRAAVLLPGQPVALFEVRDGQVAPVGGCTAEIVGADALRPGDGGTAAVELVLTADGVEVSLDGAVVLSCDRGSTVRGRSGIGVVGDAGARLRIDLLQVQR